MAKTLLEKQLQDIDAQIICLSALVAKTFTRYLEVYGKRDPALCDLVSASESTFKGMKADIEQRAFRLFTLQHLLAGSNLRYLISVPVLVKDLVSIGEQTMSAAMLLKRILLPLISAVVNEDTREDFTSTDKSREAINAARRTEQMLLADLLELSEQAEHRMGKTINAFAIQNVQMARMLLQEKSNIKTQYQQIYTTLIGMRTNMYDNVIHCYDEQRQQHIAFSLLLAQQLAQVIDYCNDICERTIFIVEGGSMPTTLY